AVVLVLPLQAVRPGRPPAHAHRHGFPLVPRLAGAGRTPPSNRRQSLPPASGAATLPRGLPGPARAGAGSGVGERSLAPEGRHPRVCQRGRPTTPPAGGPGARTPVGCGGGVLPRLGERAAGPDRRLAAGDGGVARRRASGRAGRATTRSG